METYQAATWALSVYGGMISETEIAKKVGLGTMTISKVKRLNEMLTHRYNTDKGSKLKTEP